MLPEIQKLLEAHPVRRNKEQKQAFLAAAKTVFEEAGCAARVSTDKIYVTNYNLIAGELNGAQLVFTAHYDTPFRMFLPANTIFSRNVLLSLLLQLVMIAAPMVLAAWLVGVGLTAFGVSAFWIVEARLIVALLVMVLLFFAFPNKHNVNDNSSGVAAVLELAHALAPEKQAAFVLFDNEELGLFGSMAFAKKYKQELKNAVIINMDCIGVGDELRFLLSPAVCKDERFSRALKESVPAIAGKSIEIVSGKGWFYPSDQSNFKKHVAVAAFKKGPLGLYITGIHVDWDRYLEEENLSAVVETLAAFTIRFFALRIRINRIER